MQIGLLHSMCKELQEKWPNAYADILGSKNYPKIAGTVKFYKWKKGSIVAIEIDGLPQRIGEEKYPILGFHIHEGNRCSGNDKDYFADTLGHFNPKNYPHPQHAGDMPPIFANDGIGIMVFYTDRFTPKDIVGKTVVVHKMPDDFKTQPSGGSGEKIACGEIEKVS